MKKISIGSVIFLFSVLQNNSLAQSTVEKTHHEIFKIVISPNDTTLLVKDVVVEPHELERLRKAHNGLTREPVTPCINDTGIFSRKYLRLREIEKVELDTKNLRPNVMYGVSHHFPKIVIGLNGETFKSDAFQADTKGAPWGACKAEGPISFPYWVHTLQAQSFQLDAPLIFETKRIKSIKHLSFEDFEDIKNDQLDMLLKINNTDDLNYLKNLVEKYKFSDIIGITKIARMKINEKEDELRAPLINAQKRQHEEQEILRRERAQDFEREMSLFRSNLQVGTETNCGPILETRGDLLKIYVPVANFGSEHWIRKGNVFPPGMGCRFHNGNYVGR